MHQNGDAELLEHEEMDQYDRGHGLERTNGQMQMAIDVN